MADVSGSESLRSLLTSFFAWDTGRFAERFGRHQSALSHLAMRSPVDSDRTIRFISEAIARSAWEATAYLLDFRDDRGGIGDLGDLELLSLSLPNYFRGEASGSQDLGRTEPVLPPHAGQVVATSVAIFMGPPLSALDPHAEAAVPVFDLRADRPEEMLNHHVVPPSSWPGGNLRWLEDIANRRAGGVRELSVGQFFRDTLAVDDLFRDGAGNLALLLRHWTHQRRAPAAILAALVDSVWSAMYAAKNRHGLKPPVPRRPLTIPVTADLPGQVQDRLRGWLAEVTDVHPDIVRAEWERVEGQLMTLAPGSIRKEKPTVAIPPSDAAASQEAVALTPNAPGAEAQRFPVDRQGITFVSRTQIKYGNLTADGQQSAVYFLLAFMELLAGRDDGEVLASTVMKRAGGESESNHNGRMTGVNNLLGKVRYPKSLSQTTDPLDERIYLKWGAARQTKSKDPKAKKVK